MFILQFICYNIILLSLPNPHNLLINRYLFRTNIPVHMVVTEEPLLEIYRLPNFFKVIRQDIRLKQRTAQQDLGADWRFSALSGPSPTPTLHPSYKFHSTCRSHKTYCNISSSNSLISSANIIIVPYPDSLHPIFRQKNLLNHL